MPLAAVATGVLLLLPFLVVSIPPIADLPQQAAQVRLFFETLQGERPGLEIQWLAPNKLSYLLLAAFLQVLPPLAGARLAAGAMAVLWVAAVFLLAAVRRRPLYQAILVAPLVFNHVLYMGFFNFLLGLPVFVLLFLLVAEGEGLPLRRQALAMLAVATLLYLSHVLWLGAGLAWAGGHALLRRFDGRRLAALALGAAPALGAALLWYPQLAQRGWQTASPYGALPWERLHPLRLTQLTLGGLHGNLEPLYLGVLLVAGCVGLWQWRGRFAQGGDRELLLAAAFFLALGLLLPSKVDKTIFFASRWMPVAATLLFLALPPLRLRQRLRRALALALVAAFGLGTAATWFSFEREELAGLEEALAAVPADAAVIGLDFYRRSRRLKPPPFLQLHAYAQLLHGGRLNFSFVDHASSLVVRRDQRPDPWTSYLEWAPQRVQPSDWRHFDHALIGAPAGVEEVLPGGELLQPVTEGERWRLYRITAAPGPSVEEDAEPPARRLDGDEADGVVSPAGPADG